MSEEEEKRGSLPGGPMPLTEPRQGLRLAFCVCWVQTKGIGSEPSDQLMMAGVPPYLCCPSQGTSSL